MMGGGEEGCLRHCLPAPCPPLAPLLACLPACLQLRNIPNKYTQAMLLEDLAASGLPPGRAFDFTYLPIDFRNHCNLGYAFLNMASPGDVLALFDARHGRPWPRFNSKKTCEVSWARIQGQAALASRFSASPKILDAPYEYRPVLFFRSSSGGGPSSAAAAAAAAADGSS